jgi:multiple sugar transport system permease protein
LLYLWKNIGYNIVLFLVGLNNIPKVYSEVYALEGASWRSIFRNVTLVYLSPTTFFVIIISIINSFKIFRESYLLTGRYPDDSLYMLQYYLNNVFAKLDYQKLSTAAILIFGFICVLILIFYGIEREVAKNTSI